MEPENHASLMGRKSILARGTCASSFRKRGSRFAALRLSKYAMTAAPNARTDAIAVTRSRRHASTAPSRPPDFAVGGETNQIVIGNRSLISAELYDPATGR